MSDRFPSINPLDPSVIATGHEHLFINGQLVLANASGPQYLLDGTLLCTRNANGNADDGAVLRYARGNVFEFHAPGLEGWSAHNGIFAGWRRGDRLKAVTVSRSGHRAGLVDLGGATILEVDGQEIDRGPIAEPRYTNEALVWTKFVNGKRRTFGRLAHGAPTEDLTVLPDDEFWPRAVETPKGVYVLTHSHPEKGYPLILRPWGPRQQRGYIVAHGFTDRPDLIAVGDSVLIAFSNLRELVRRTVDLSAPMELLAQPGPPDPPPPPPVPPVDVPPVGATPVQLESKHSALIEEFADRFGLPGFSKEEGQEWVARLAGTFKARFPSEGWGTKRASNSRPLSNESIARRVGNRLWGYDLIIGAGAPGQTLASHAHAEDITDQVFVEVTSRDWLGGATPQPTPTPTPAPPRPAEFPSYVIPWDIFLEGFYRYRANIHERDWTGDSVGGGALAYFIPHFINGANDAIKQFGVPVNDVPPQEYADRWRRIVNPGIERAIAAYQRDQGRP